MLLGMVKQGLNKLGYTTTLHTKERLTVAKGNELISINNEESALIVDIEINSQLTSVRAYVKNNITVVGFIEDIVYR